MVAGHLQEKRGYFYIVLNYKDSNGKRKSKWIATSLPVKGNKRKADELLQQARIEFKPEAEEPKPEVPAASVPVTALTGDVLFADFMLSWLDVIKRSVSPVTFSSYSGMVKSIVRNQLQFHRHIQRLVYVGVVVYDGIRGDSLYFLVIKRLYITRLQG